MPWLCKTCGLLVANISRCPECKTAGIGNTFDESERLLGLVRIKELDKILWIVEGFNMSEIDDKKSSMNPKEALFAKFFADEKELIKDMDDLQLRAHREELSLIASEARARLTAIENEGQERNKRGKNKKFEDESGDFASDAINKIAERQKKMSRTDKEIERLVALGMERADAERMYSATNALEIRDGKKTDLTKPKVDKVIPTITDRKCPECEFIFPPKISGTHLCPECRTMVIIVKDEKKDEVIPKAIVNPFAKTAPPIEIVTNNEQEKETKVFKNPFAKG